MSLCVESPWYLVSVHKIQETMYSLQHLRSGADVMLELYNDVESKQPVQIKDYDMSKDDNLRVSTLPYHDAPMSMTDILQDPLQLIGIHAVMYYSTDMFTVVFDSTMAKYMSIVTFVINFVDVFPDVFLMDRMGRRMLLLVSATGSTLYGLVGCSPIPWILISELTSAHTSSAVGSKATGINWSMNFLVGQCFPLVFKRMEGYAFIVFGVIGVLIVLFTFFHMPETRKRFLEDIVNQFKASL
ncbi:general substrate transporter [Gilbertella persicaria]|uniref:Major facilitator superfamily (MFS) profile domain-containing protein n=1 Tax=Rhizopus stolonifer TaxID=4846 RepID=A0A367JJU6_RHIST|nr:general substrate transporter [Gilbertella persicaria]KAI8069017.1 general substrate transporter [Gilbertella persicaria]RCH90176.1 hypothetical protein CU098_009512 [Rhizopus stolonifer]